MNRDRSPDERVQRKVLELNGLWLKTDSSDFTNDWGQRKNAKNSKNSGILASGLFIWTRLTLRERFVGAIANKNDIGWEKI
jgi:hypothetical protein